jgi:hypothetical protein
VAATTITGAVGGANDRFASSLAARPQVLWLAPARALAVSACVLIPCFWQSRIQAGDLGSHIYSAALGSLAREGKLSGIEVIPQWTNVLFDLLLARLLAVFGASLAQQLAVSAAVLVFFWGAFSLLSATAGGRRPWHLAPVIAMLAFGWVFHAGFFNFYIGLGFGFAALAVLFGGSSRRRLALAALWLTLALAAHALAAGWALGACVFVLLSHRLNTRSRWMLAGAVLVLLVQLRLGLSALFVTFWATVQATCLTGADQLWVYGSRNYFLPTIGLVLVWTLLGLRRLEQKQPLGHASAVALQLAVITAAAVLILPNTILVPNVASSFCYMAFRTSLAAAVMLTAAVAAVRPSRGEVALTVVLATLFFTLLYSDTRRLNDLEDRVTAAVRSIPPGERVISALCWREGRIDPSVHMVDRACVGHCFSYAAYEPSSGQFRVRALRPNPYVLSRRTDVVRVEGGQYRVALSDLPLYQVELRGLAGQVQVRSLHAGEMVGRVCQAGS